MLPQFKKNTYMTYWGHLSGCYPSAWTLITEHFMGRNSWLVEENGLLSWKVMWVPYFLGFMLASPFRMLGDSLVIETPCALLGCELWSTTHFYSSLDNTTTDQIEVLFRGARARQKPPCIFSPLPNISLLLTLGLNLTLFICPSCIV